MRRCSSVVRRRAFISVGAVRQRPLNILVSLMVLALWFLRRMTVVVVNCVGGMSVAVLRRGGNATRRLNSSLRSHRTWRSSCRHVLAGLNKTMFAAVGPNSHCRGHQGRLFSLGENESRLGRMKAGRGHQSAGASSPERDATKIPHDVNDPWSPGLSHLLLSSEACVVSGRSTVSDRSTLEGFSVSHHGVQHAQAVAGPWRRWPWACRCAARVADGSLPAAHRTGTESRPPGTRPSASVTEPALVMLPLWVRPADSFMSAVRPAQNSRVSALGKRSKGPTSAAMIAAQISPMPGTLVSREMISANRLLRVAKIISRRSRSR